MGCYTRPQLTLVASLLAAATLGLGVMHWRAAHPELAERLERIDQEIARSTEAAPDEPRATEAPTPGDPRPSTPSRASKRLTLPPGEPGAPLDLNRATLSDLVRLPGVGPVLAGRILATREEVGRFAAVDDLVTVRGLGRVRLERLRPFVGVLE